VTQSFAEPHPRGPHRAGAGGTDRSGPKGPQWMPGPAERRQGGHRTGGVPDERGRRRRRNAM